MEFHQFLLTFQIVLLLWLVLVIISFLSTTGDLSNFPGVVTWCQQLGPFLPEYEATAECSDSGSAAVNIMPAHSSALVRAEQSIVVMATLLQAHYDSAFNFP